MKTKLPGLLLTAHAIFLGCVARADVVTDRNTTALNAIKVDRTAPPKAARALAILHVAIDDAVNGLNGTHEPYLACGRAPRSASAEAAVSAAARAALVSLFPAQQAAFDAAYTAAIALIASGVRKDAGIAWGVAVAGQALAARADDGSTATKAGLSRVFGGIHFVAANQQGLQSGARLGHYVVENFLLEKDRRGHGHGRR
jgi:hypothetical protein